MSRLKDLPEELLGTIIAKISGMIPEPDDANREVTCPHCGGRTVKNGTQCGRQRHRCKACGDTFTCTVNTVCYYSRAKLDVWKEVISDTYQFVSIDKTAERLGFTHDRVFRMRHKILAALETEQMCEPAEMSTIVELDETYVLESHKGTPTPQDYWRGPRKHGAKAQKRGVSNEYVCVCTGVGRDSGAVAVSVNRAKPDAEELKQVFKPHLTEGMLAICDGHKAYLALESECGCTVVNARETQDKFLHLNTVNNFHSFLKRRYNQYGGVAALSRELCK